MNDNELNALKKGILSGDLASLGRAITLLESDHPKHWPLAKRILKEFAQKKESQSFRLGISGPPGVGKSTFY